MYHAWMGWVKNSSDPMMPAASEGSWDPISQDQSVTKPPVGNSPIMAVL